MTETLPPGGVTNRALAYGDGLFESMLVCHGEVPFWRYHWQRLQEGARRLQLDIPNEHALRRGVARESGRGSGVLKLVLYRRSSADQRGYCPPGTASEYAVRFFPGNIVRTGAGEPLRLIICSLRLAWQPALAGIKHLNRLENVLACAQVRQHGADDGLLLDADDNIIEATGSNVIFLRGRHLYTPELDRCGVHGVALQWLKTRYPVTVSSIPLASMDGFDALLLCNSVRGFRVVGQVGHHRFDADRQKAVVQEYIDEITTAWLQSCSGRDV